MSRPVVWMWKDEQRDPYYGMGEVFVGLVKEYFDIVWYDDLLDQPHLGAQVKGAFTVMYTYKYFKEQHHVMPNVKIVANCGIGYDHIDVQCLAECGIAVTNIANTTGVAVADMAIGLLLASARDIYKGMKLLKESSTLNVNMLGQNVTGSTLGVVGLGSIGLRTAQRARGFNMQILYHQRNRNKEAAESLGRATYYGELNEMLPRCDFVVIACPLTMATENMFGAKEFNLMKPTATIINIARGQIIDQDALVSALEKGEIRGAALDVTHPEPLPPDHPLWNMDNVIITPHAATATHSTREVMGQACIANLRAALIDNTPLPDLVKPSALL